ncbi:c-type cytochrome [Stenotrophomonas rhizophila]|nr:c-type cytochrome [Stenotrophomonas rhizophila]
MTALMPVALVVGAFLTFNAAAADSVQDAALIKRGEYVARAGDCIACHTNGTSGKPFAGGYTIESPMGTIYATNITPSKVAGIGRWSEEQFARAVRQGVAADGRRLYPAMPYTDYAGISDDDIHALYAYLNARVEPVDTEAAHVTDLGFPFKFRGLMWAWNLLFLDKPDTSAKAPATDDTVQRGRYLVDTLGHCGSCHTPRNALMASDNSRYLSGGEVAGWVAPNITSDPISGIGGWSEDELVKYLSSGHVPGKGQAAGGMAEAIEHSLRHLDESDLQAMAMYLKQVPAASVKGEKRPAYSYGPAALPAGYNFDDPQSHRSLEDAARTTPNGKELLASRSYTEYDRVTDGARLYANACASCHQPNGQGTGDNYYPSLTHNTTVGASTPNNLVMTILDGVHRQGSDGPTAMPGFAHDMTDEQVAAVANYVSQRFGNPEMRVTAEEVTVLRAGGPVPLIRKLVPWLAAAGALALVLVAWLVFRRVRRRPREQGCLT